MKNVRKPRLAVLRIALTTTTILLGSGTAYAQDGGTTAAAASTQGGLEDIVVTARRRSEDLQRQPLSITALSTATLEQRNVQKLSDIVSVPNVNFNNQAGFVNTLVPFIRGIGEADPVLTNDSPVSIYVDGVVFARSIGSLLDVVDPERIEVLRGPQGSLFGRNTTGGAISITSAAPTEEMGVLFRGGYASDNEITLRGTLNTGNIGSSSVRMKLTYQHHQNDGWTRNLSTSKRFRWSGSDNTDTVFASLHAGDGPFTMDLRGDYTDTRGVLNQGQLTVASQPFLDFGAASPSFGGDPLLVSPKYLSSRFELPNAPRSTGKIGGGSLTLNYAVSPAFNIKSITAYRKLHTNANTNSTGSGNIQGLVFDQFTGATNGVVVGLAQPLRMTVDEFASGADQSRQNQFTQEFQVSGEAGRHKYVGGLFYFRERVSERYIVSFALPGLVVPGDNLIAFRGYGGNFYRAYSRSMAAYFSDTWTPPILDDRLELTGGIRYTKDRKTLNFIALPPIYTQTSSFGRDFSKLSGDFTANFQWTPDVMTYFRFANGYKAGGFSGRDDQGQTGYDPETANNYEVGFKATLFDRMLRVNGDVFYTKYNNKQVTTFLAELNSNGVQSSRVVNAAAATYKGAELEVTLVPTRGFQIDSSFGYTKPKYTQFLYFPTVTATTPTDISDQAVFGYFSKTTFSIGATYTLYDLPFGGDLAFNMNYSYKSGQYWHPSLLFNPLNEILKSNGLNDLTANITLNRLMLGGVEVQISAYAKNLLNEHQRTQGTDYEFGPGLFFGTNSYNRPRVFGVNLQGKF